MKGPIYIPTRIPITTALKTTRLRNCIGPFPRAPSEIICSFAFQPSLAMLLHRSSAPPWSPSLPQLRLLPSVTRNKNNAGLLPGPVTRWRQHLLAVLSSVTATDRHTNSWEAWQDLSRPRTTWGNLLTLSHAENGAGSPVLRASPGNIQSLRPEWPPYF